MDAGLAGGVAADGLESTHLGEARLAAAMAARAAAAADAAGSSIAGIVVLLCVSFFENAAIMMRASRFIVSISIAGNSDTPPLVSPAFDETAVRDDATRGTESSMSRAAREAAERRRRMGGGFFETAPALPEPLPGSSAPDPTSG